VVPSTTIELSLVESGDCELAPDALTRLHAAVPRPTTES
jgi:hypothetical protein